MSGSYLLNFSFSSLNKHVSISFTPEPLGGEPHPPHCGQGDWICPENILNQECQEALQLICGG